MKKPLLSACKYFSAALLLLAASGLNAQNNKTGSAGHYNAYDSGNDTYTWINLDSLSFSYDNSQRLSQITYYSADSTNTYLPYYKNNYSYTNFDSISSIVNLAYNNNQVDSSDRQNYFYDGNHRLVKIEYQSYISGFGWRNSGEHLYTRDGNGNMLSQEFMSWDTLNNVFVPMLNAQKILNTYNGNNHLTSSTITTYNGSTYVNSIQETLTYQGNLLSITIRGFWTGSQWLTDLKDSMVYDGNSKLIADYYFFQMFLGTSPWALSEKVTYVYDGNGNQTEVNSWAYDTASSTYSAQPYMKMVNDFDNNNHLKKTTHLTWDTLTSTYHINEDVVIYYGNPAGVKNITGTSNTNIFPNPCTNVLHINTQSNASVSLHDVTGKEIYSSSTNGNQVILNTEHLPNGIYFLKTSSEQDQSVQKIMKVN